MRRSGTNFSGSVWGSRLRSDRVNVREEGKLMELFQEALNSSPTKTYQREPSTPSFQGLRSALSEDGRGGAPAIRRMRRAASLPPSVLLFAGTVHSPAAPLLASSASPRFGMPPPVQAPEPGSGYCCSAERTRGREKCFRGNGPRVGVCKLASVPAGAAVATGLARRAGAWRRRRAAGKTAGGRAWQVGAGSESAP